MAVIREEGSNGDREMAAALLLAGFSVSDVTMQDLRTGAATLADYRGVVFVGGFRCERPPASCLLSRAP